MKSTTKQMSMYMMRTIMLMETFHQVLGSVQIGVSRVAAKTEDYNHGIVSIVKEGEGEGECEEYMNRKGRKQRLQRLVYSSP